MFTFAAKRNNTIQRPKNKVINFLGSLRNISQILSQHRKLSLNERKNKAFSEKISKTTVLRERGARKKELNSASKPIFFIIFRGPQALFAFRLRGNPSGQAPAQAVIHLGNDRQPLARKPSDSNPGTPGQQSGELPLSQRA
jgi:hypothetical protein